jgi:hypothetical protein
MQQQKLRQKLSKEEKEICFLLRHAAEELWDIAETIFQTGTAWADEWDMARITLSHTLLALERPPASDHKPLYQAKKQTQ